MLKAAVKARLPCRPESLKYVVYPPVVHSAWHTIFM